MKKMQARSFALLAFGFCAYAFTFGMATPATARVWVSVNGSDADPKCGAATEPCRSFQHAHDISPAGGEIDVAVPGGYGALTITKALTINAGAAGPAIIQATSGVPNGIVINANPGDAIYLNGLWIDGAQNTGSGIVFNSGSALTITNCTVRHFAANGTRAASGNGVFFAPAAGPVSLTVTNSVFSDNGNAGFLAYPSGSVGISASIDRLIASNNNYGIYIFDSATAGGIAGVDDNFSISNSFMINNSTFGLDTIDINAAQQQSNDFLYVNLRNNDISLNKQGGINYQILNAGYILSYGGNIISSNGVSNIIGGAPLTSATQ